MNISLNIISLFVFALIAQGIFAGVILIVKPENKAANRYLAILTFLLALWLCDTFFRVSGIYQQNPNFYFLPIYFSLGFGPLIYFYTKKLTQQQVSFSYPQLLHFIPVTLQLLFYIFLQTQDYEFRRDFWFNVHRPYTYDLELILSFISLIVYLLWSRKLIRRYRQKIENSFSSIHAITLQWLNRLHLVLAGLSLVWLLEAAGRLILTYYPITPFSALTIGIIILFIAIGGILQKNLQPITAEMEQKDKEQLTLKIEQPIEPEAVEQIQKIMIEQELFLQQELTLKEFAKAVHHSPRETSRLINQGLQMTFIDFVNQYRVSRFKELAKSERHQHLNLLGLAYESGFNSKSTFNRIFKKMEGKSPSAYQKASQNAT